jgi:hypothetical protein
MDGQADVLSFGSGRRRGGRRPGWQPGWRGWVAVAAVGVLAAGAYLTLLVAHRDGTIDDLHAALRQARQPAAAAQPGLPVESGSALSIFPDGAAWSFSMVTAAVRPKPGSAALTWLFVYGQHASPGQRYGLLEGTCGGQFVTASDLADGTADRRGDLTIVAPNLEISASDSDVWVLVYRLEDGVTLGGIQGPLIGSGAKAFRTTPPC